MTTSAPDPSFPAQTPRRVSRTGLELIKSFEGFRPRAARLPGGRYVIGYGHVSSTREGVRISEADAHALLVYDLLQIEASVNEWALAPLTQNQFDALVSFALSIGLKNFRRSDALRHVNQGSMLQAASALDMWRQAELDGETVVVDALVRRRAAEKALFLTPAEGHVPASSAVLRAVLDDSARSSIPAEAPEQVSVPLEGEVATFTRGPQVDAEDFAPTGALAETPEPLAAVSDEGLDSVLDDASAEEQVPLADAAPQSAEAPVEDEDEAGESEPAPLQVSPFIDMSRSEPDLEEEAEPEDDEWSAARAAAAAVTARLHELLPREEFVDEAEVLPLHPSPPEDDHDEEAAFAGGDTLPEIEPFPLNEIVEDQAPARAEPVLEPFAGASSSAANSEEADDVQPLDLAEYEPLPTLREPQPTGPYLLLGLVGLLFIIAALVSLFRSPATGGAEDGVSAISWILGLIGIAGVAGALWMTLGREETASDPQADS